MPFKKRNSEDYFEAVEISQLIPKELDQAALALYPVCAAKYKEFVKRAEGQEEKLIGEIRKAGSPELSLSLGQETATLHFEESRWEDLRTILEETDG